MKKAALVVCFLDCCRMFTSRGPESASISGPKCGSIQKMILYACAPNGEAYDGKGLHGSVFICKNRTLHSCTLTHNFYAKYSCKRGYGVLSVET